MSDIIRDAPIGQLIRLITRNKVLLYPEERPDFVIPASYLPRDSIKDPLPASSRTSRTELATEKEDFSGDDDLAKPAAVEPEEEFAPQEKPRVLGAADDAPISPDDNALRDTRPQLERVGTRSSLRSITSRADLERAITAASQTVDPSQVIVPQRTADGVILVDWYTEGDAENPQHWRLAKKATVTAVIFFYTMAVYMGSSIITASEAGIERQFHVGSEAASLVLALYTLAYGIGPLLFSPLSEIPSVGRNPPYMISMAIFVILCVPAALTPDFAGLLVLRFLQGFFGSPCLATGGASIGDVWSVHALPYMMCLWALGATCGPALGPLISGFSVAAENWRWSLWEILWFAGPVFVFMLLCLPETSAATVLYRRAQRLRALTGNPLLKAQSEIDQANMQPKDVAFEALVRPIQLMVMDPAIAFTALYTALCYGIYYSFFEAFPLVYIDMYGFNEGELGLTFLSITVGVLIAMSAYYAYLHWYLDPRIAARGFGEPEERLLPALFASFFCPVGLFLFGWTSNPDIHWIVSVIGIVLFTIGIFVIMQCIFIYLPFVYPQYAASLFAGNDFARSSLAFAAVLFSSPMYEGLGIGPGSSLLGGLTAGCIIGVFVLFYFGKSLRARSRFSAK